jgi:hypothetical protein
VARPPRLYPRALLRLSQPAKHEPRQSPREGGPLQGAPTWRGPPESSRVLRPRIADKLRRGEGQRCAELIGNAQLERPAQPRAAELQVGNADADDAVKKGFHGGRQRTKERDENRTHGHQIFGYEQSYATYNRMVRFSGEGSPARPPASTVQKSRVPSTRSRVRSIHDGYSLD